MEFSEIISTLGPYIFPMLATVASAYFSFRLSIKRIAENKKKIDAESDNIIADSVGKIVDAQNKVIDTLRADMEARVSHIEDENEKCREEKKIIYAEHKKVNRLFIETLNYVKYLLTGVNDLRLQLIDKGFTPVFEPTDIPDNIRIEIKE